MCGIVEVANMLTRWLEVVVLQDFHYWFVANMIYKFFDRHVIKNGTKIWGVKRFFIRKISSEEWLNFWNCTGLCSSLLKKLRDPA